ncbi:MAG: DUF5719 family protein [Nocardioides sp.]|nr:DUF5719 family protein [Nocardioides sp.]
MSARRATRRAPARQGARARAVVLVLLVLGLAGSLVVLLTANEPPADGEAAPERTPVERIALACPTARSASTVTVGALPLPDIDPGPVDGLEVLGEALPIGRPGVLEAELPRTGPAEERAALVRGEGAAAPGLTATVAATSPRLSAARCTAPASRRWFTGAGGGVEHASTLELVNPEEGPAVVSVTVLGAEGPVETAGVREISVPAGGRVEVDLAEVAPATGELAVGVRTTRGRVGVAVRDRLGPPGTRPAEDLLPGQERPRRTTVLAGLPTGADEHLLLMANPGDDEVVAVVSVVGPGGTFTPAEGAELVVPPGTVRTLDVGGEIGAEVAALRVEATGPVVGTVRSRAGADITYAPVARDLGRRAALALPAGVAAVLQLSSDSEEGEVEVVTFDADGTEIGRGDVVVPAAGTIAVDLPPRARLVRVSPGATTVRGAVALTSDAGVATLPLDRLVTRVAEPDVRPAVR